MQTGGRGATQSRLGRKEKYESAQHEAEQHPGSASARHDLHFAHRKIVSHHDFVKIGGWSTGPECAAKSSPLFVIRLSREYTL
jgi:hypothetical protein